MKINRKHFLHDLKMAKICGAPKITQDAALTRFSATSANESNVGLPRKAIMTSKPTQNSNPAAMCLISVYVYSISIICHESTSSLIGTGIGSR